MKRCAAALVLAVTGVLAPGGARAELFMYATPDGHTVYSDRVLSGPGYAPRNAAARRGPQRYVPPPKATAVPVAARKRATGVDVQARAQVDAIIDRLAPDYRLDPALVRRVVEAESGYRVRAVSPKNAQGLMQLIPATQDRFGVTDPYDAEQNLRGGMAYLRWLMAQFRGDVRLALAGYNAGEGAVLDHGGVPPYAETQAYVTRIVGRYGKTVHPYDADAAGGMRLARASRGPRVAIINGRDMLAGGRLVLADGGRVIASGRSGDQARVVASGRGGR